MMCYFHVNLLSRVMPRYLTESLLGIAIFLMVTLGHVFLQREGYMCGFIFVNFEAQFIKPLFHRVEISLESGGYDYRVYVGC